MLEPWNDKSLSPPPVNTAKCYRDIDLQTLQHALKLIINILSKQSPLHQESAIVSRLLYKFDKKFRNDIGYRFFKKVNCALKRYLLLNLLKDVEQFMSVLPDEEDPPYYLPTKQMLEYILIRLMAFSKLMFRIVVCSKQAAVFYLDRVRRGDKNWMSLMPYALVSRVWSMTFVLLQHSCSWYQLLYPFLDKLQFKGLNFLPVDYKLPLNLGDWLEIKDINDFGRLEWTSKEIVNADALLFNDDTDDLDNILQYVNQINEDPSETQESCIEPAVKQNITPSNIKNVSIKQTDQGEAISRESFMKLMNEQKSVSDTNSKNVESCVEPAVKKNITPSNIKNVSIKQTDKGEAISRESFMKLVNEKTSISDTNSKNVGCLHVIDGVTDKNTLQKFIDQEETFRNEGNNRSLTTHLSFMQWQSLKQSLIKLDSLTSNNRKLQRKFLKIWQDKCVNVE